MRYARSMGAIYVVFAGVAFYLLLLRTLDSPKMNAVKAATFLIVDYYALLVLVMSMEYAAKDMPLLPNILEPSFVITAIVRWIVAVGVFYKVEESGDSYLSYMAWGGLGLALIFFVAPPMVQQLFTLIVY